MYFAASFRFENHHFFQVPAPLDLPERETGVLFEEGRWTHEVRPSKACFGLRDVASDPTSSCAMAKFCEAFFWKHTAGVRLGA